MLKTVKVMIMMGVMLLGAGAVDEEKRKYTSDFDLLCTVMKAVTGVWQSFVDPNDFIHEKQSVELGKTIDDIFFGSKWGTNRGGILMLPERFSGTKPGRTEVCGSKGDSLEMPPPRESMASAFLCLCTLTNAGEDFCGLDIETNIKWPVDQGQSIRDVFEKVWGNGFNGKIVDKCEVREGSFSNLEQENQIFSKELTTLKNTLKIKKGIFGKENNTCEGKTPCANITEYPTWLTKLEEIKNIATLTITRIQEIKEKSLIEHDSTQQTSPEHVPELTPEATSPPTNKDSSSKASEETTTREARKASTPKNEAQSKAEAENHVKTPQMKEEDHLPVPENNETSGSYITSAKWPFLAALFI